MAFLDEIKIFLSLHGEFQMLEFMKGTGCMHIM